MYQYSIPVQKSFSNRFFDRSGALSAAHHIFEAINRDVCLKKFVLKKQCSLKKKGLYLKWEKPAHMVKRAAPRVKALKTGTYGKPTHQLSPNSRATFRTAYKYFRVLFVKDFCLNFVLKVQMPVKLLRGVAKYVFSLSVATP